MTPAIKPAAAARSPARLRLLDADAPQAQAGAAATRLALAGLEPALTMADWPVLLSCSRREVERMKSAGKLPPPSFYVGRMPRWSAAAARAWLAEQGGGR